RVLQDAHFGHALEEALAGGGAPAPGSDGAGQGADPAFIARNRQQLRGSRSYDGPPRVPPDRQTSGIGPGVEPRRQFPPPGPSELTIKSMRERARSGLELPGFPVYNLLISRKRPDFSKSPQSVHRAYACYPQGFSLHNPLIVK